MNIIEYTILTLLSKGSVEINEFINILNKDYSKIVVIAETIKMIFEGLIQYDGDEIYMTGLGCNEYKGECYSKDCKETI